MQKEVSGTTGLGTWYTMEEAHKHTHTLSLSLSQLLPQLPLCGM